MLNQEANLKINNTITNPPVIVFYDGEKYWLGDNEVEVRQGTKRDALLYSVLGACQDGIQRKSSEKRRAVVTLLTDDEWKSWSDREIARRCNVSQAMVSYIRKELYPQKESDDDKRRAVVTLLTDDEWKDWSSREIARHCNVCPNTVERIRKELSLEQDNETRKFNRGGKTYAQKVAKTAKP